MPFVAGAGNRLARWAAIGLGLSIPVSVALDNVLLGLLLAGWAMGGEFGQKWKFVRDNPVALAAGALWLLLLAGAFHGNFLDREPWDALNKYRDLLLIPVLMPLFRDPAARTAGLTTFACAMALTLALSLAIAAFDLRGVPLLKGDPHNPAVFKLHITHNFLMAFAAFQFALSGRLASSSKAKIALFGLSILAVFDILFLVQGRTGWFVLAALAVYFLSDGLRGRGVGIAVLAIAMVGAAVYSGSGAFRERLDLAGREFSDWRPGEAVAVSNSIGLRLEWARNTLDIIARHPWFGVGTGRFAGAYAAKVKDSGMVPTDQPHNEYLLLAAQAGIAGFVLLLLTFAVQWRRATRLAPPLERRLGHGLVIAMAVGCLFNSFLLDHTEGLFFAWMSALVFSAPLRDGSTAETPGRVDKKS